MSPCVRFLGHGPRSEIAAGLGSSIFSFSRKPAAFSTATAPPCRPADGTRECRFPLPPQPALASWVPLVAALLGVAGASFAVFTHVSRVIGDAERPFVRLPAIRVCPGETPLQVWARFCALLFFSRRWALGVLCSGD